MAAGLLSLSEAGSRRLDKPIDLRCAATKAGPKFGECMGREQRAGETAVASLRQHESLAPSNMILVPGGTFRMGSDKHYPEEAPAHNVTVSGFWIDRTPVTN